METRGSRSARRATEEREKFIRSVEGGADLQRRVLAGCLASNRDSQFGREHGFGEITGVDAFRRRVPIRSYEELAPWIARAAAGEPGVLTAEPPVLFFTSSGTTGTHKKIPVTAQFMRECFIPFAYAAMGTFFAYHPEAGERDDATVNFKWDPNVNLGTTASGRPHLGASQVDYGKMFGEELASEPGTRAPWAAPPAEITRHLDRLYYRVRLSVGADVRALIGINPAVVAAIAQQIPAWTDRLIEEVAAGTVLGQPLLSPDPDRAQLLAGLARHFGRLQPHHLWPSLQVVFCWTGAAASVYLPALRAAFGPRVDIMPAPVAASESPIGIGVDHHPSAGVLVLPYVFFEFVEADRQVRADGRTLLHDELQVGGEYQVILTHCGGLTRYALGDVLRVVDRFRDVPRVEFVARRHQLGLAGAPLGEWQLLEVLRAALPQVGLELTNFRFREPDGPLDRVELVVEPRGPCGPGDLELLGRVLDAGLAGVHAAYREARGAGAFAGPAVAAAPPGTFLAVWEARVEAGTRPAQVKDRMVEADAAAWARLRREGDPAQPSASASAASS